MNSFTNSRSFLNFIHNNNIDLVFSDIEMKELDGLSLNSLVNPPLFVFISSFPSYRLESFKFDPLHYIVKIDDIEIKVVIDRHIIV